MRADVAVGRYRGASNGYAGATLPLAFAVYRKHNGALELLVKKASAATHHPRWSLLKRRAERKRALTRASLVFAACCLNGMAGVVPDWRMPCLLLF